LVYIVNMKRIVRKTLKIVMTAVMAIVFLPVRSFAQSGLASGTHTYAAQSSVEYLAPQVSYNFGFFASIFLIILLSGLLYILKNKTVANKQ